MKAILTGFVLPLLIALVLFAGLVVFVFPTGTWLDQRAEAKELEESLVQLTAEQAELRDEISRMRTPAEIERIARRDFGLVFPGEEAYALLPAPPTPLQLPASWPLSILHGQS